MSKSQEHDALVSIWATVEDVWAAVKDCRSGIDRGNDCDMLASNLRKQVADYENSGGKLRETTAWMINEVLQVAREVTER